MKSRVLNTNTIISLINTKFFFLVSLFILLLSSNVVLNQDVKADQLVCPSSLIEQITDNESGNFSPSINADGNYIAFSSSANINGGNPDGTPEIYLYDATTRTFRQITNETEGDSTSPSVNADGTRIAFQTRSNINGGNPDGNLEIYLYDTTTMIFTQITNDINTASVNAVMSADGTHVGFNSNANINGGNTEDNMEVYLYNISTGTIIQITDETEGQSEVPALNIDATVIAFQSTANINGGDTDENGEVYIYEMSTGIITQITNDPNKGSGQPSVNADGSLVAFSSEANINGGNPDGNPEIYLYNTITGNITQITNYTGFSFDAEINLEGTRIAFTSSANINGTNPNNNPEIFIYDIADEIFADITNVSSGNSSAPSINADGNHIAFNSDINNDGNPGETQIFLAICVDPSSTRNIPTLSEWGLVAMAGILGFVGLLILQRRKVTT